MGAGAILIGFWYVFFHTGYTILDKLFESCPFMKVIPHENYVDRFFLTWGYSDIPIYFTLKR